MNSLNSLPSTLNSGYYPFGSGMSGRSFSGYRYGFGGHEKDDGVKGSGNTYDMGARLFNPRIGRTPTIDPMAVLYPKISPYVYAVNTPIQAIDPDGRLVIFINGEVGQFGWIGEGNSIDRASVSYWSQAFVNKVSSAFVDYNYIFRDGDRGILANTRKDAGIAQAKIDFLGILNNLKKDNNSKITESIKIVSHSKGAAFAAGYIEAWNELRNSDQYKDYFNKDGGKVEFSLMLASHQGMDFSLNNPEGTNVNIHHKGDDLSWSNVKGNMLNIETDNNQWAVEVFALHTIDGFHFESQKVIEQYKINKLLNATPTCLLKESAEKASKSFFDKMKGGYVNDI